MLARNLLLHGPAMERYNFLKKDLAAQRPLDQSYRDLVLEYITRTQLSGEGYYQTIPYIAWLAAGDPGLAPMIADMYIDRAANERNGAAYAKALSYFGRDILEPRAARLLALYERQFPKPEDAARFRVAVSFGIGGGGPRVVDRLIAELDAPSPDGESRAAAAAALCRARDPRAIEPLLKKVETFQRNQTIRHPMSYIYALARLGHGSEATEAAARITSRQAGSFVCLNEIVSKYPNGDAPDSICIMGGPNEQPKDAAWQYSESELKCLAPRTPAPNG